MLGKADSTDDRPRACRADIGGCCSGNTYISRVKALFAEIVYLYFAAQVTFHSHLDVC